MRLISGLLLTASLAGCAILSPRQEATSGDQALVSKLEQALLESIIHDAVSELQGEDAASYPTVLAPFAELAETSVDAKHLTPWYRGQLALLSDSANPQSRITSAELREVLDKFLGELSGDMSPESWPDQCAAPGEFTDASIQESLNQVSNLVFDFEPMLHSITSKLPRSDLEIRHAENSSPQYASFEAGTESSTFVIDLTRAPQCEIAALTYMNTIPGKLLVRQSALSAAIESTPFLDGWALYILSRLDERNLFTDEAVRAGRYRIESRILAAALINIAVSEGSWSQQDAGDFLEARLAMPQEEASKFVVQALKDSRSIQAAEGLIRLQRIRTRAMKALGDQFDEREFHDRLLELGPVPLPFVEQHVTEWLTGKSNGKIAGIAHPGE